MKKVFPILFLAFVFLLVFSAMIPTFSYASQCAQANHPDTSSSVAGATAAAHTDVANSLVPCGQYPDCQCQITDLFVMIVGLYNFAIIYLAFPLATFSLVLGGVLMLISGGNPGLIEKGKNMIKLSLYGLALVLCSYLIIDVVLKAIGYVLPWNTF